MLKDSDVLKRSENVPARPVLLSPRLTGRCEESTYVASRFGLSGGGKGGPYCALRLLLLRVFDGVKLVVS